ncbi:GAP family protein, partial [Mycolicibacterium sp.]
ASGAAAAVQFSALIVFNVVAFALVEIPLLCYLVAPDRTRAALSSLYEWVRAQGRRGVSLLLAVVGCVLVAVGFAGL